MMAGCSSFAEGRASRWKRSTNSVWKARENGNALMAASRWSCFSRALKTIAMPPRPSSSMISYSSLSWSRTRSNSVVSGWSRAVLTGVVVRSSPQERQNLLVSSFWVPQREQYITSPKGRGNNLGMRQRGCQLDACDRGSEVGAECEIELRPSGRARGLRDERLREAESQGEQEIITDGHAARELEAGGAQSGELRGRAGRPRIPRVGERIEPELVRANRAGPDGPANEREREAILDAARGRAPARERPLGQ